MERLSRDKEKYIVLFIASIILAPIILQYIIFPNTIISNVSNEGWASFFGSYLGGIIGGVGTLWAVLISTQQTKEIQKDNKLCAMDKNFKDSIRTERIQNENKELQEKQERIKFSNDIATLVGRYCADISKYYYTIHYEKHYDADRSISIECYFTLDIKLKNIQVATELLEILCKVHNMPFSDEISVNEIEQATVELREAASKFIEKYIECG